MKRFFSILMILLLTACSSKGSNFVSEKEYIRPISVGTLSDRLSDDLKMIFGQYNLKDYIINDIGMESPDLVLNDYYGNTIDFNDYKKGNLIIEVSASWCTHCAEQTAYNNQIIENSDVRVIQFFIDGDKELIKEFYDKESVDIPDNVQIIPENEELQAYFVCSNIEMVPSFYFFKDGKLTFINVGTITYEKYKAMSDYLFGEKAFNKNNLIDNMGNSIFENYRTREDILNELSEDSKNKLNQIEGAQELTLSIMGKDLALNKMYDEEASALFKIKDYGKYLNDEFVIFYLGNIYNNLEGEIELINSFKEKHPKLNMLAILVDNKDLKTSEEYGKLSKKLSIDVVSLNAQIPQVFVDTLINEYPAMLFARDNKLMGGFYHLDSLEKMENALMTFEGDTSIALKENN